MIIIKELLFELLDKAEPNDLLEIRIDRQYNNVYIANKQSAFPLAIEMQNYPNDMDERLETAYRREFFIDDLPYTTKFLMDHTIILNEKKYIVSEELVDVQYFDDYFSVTTSNQNGISTTYFRYSSIKSIKIRHESACSVVKEYNSLNCNFKSDK